MRWRQVGDGVSMPAPLRETLRADPGAPATARLLLRDWLAALGWPADEAGQLVLVVNETVTNAVQHAYPTGRAGAVGIRAEPISGPSGRRRVVLTVEDSGVWRDPRPGRNEPWRGLHLIRAVATSIEIRGSAVGTRVKVISKPVGPSADP